MKIDQKGLFFGLMGIILLFYVVMLHPQSFAGLIGYVSGAIVLVLSCASIAMAVENQ